MRLQRKLTFYIGLPAWLSVFDDMDCQDNFEKHVVDAACLVSGGCTVSRDTGWWIERAADKRLTTYAGDPQSEVCLRIEVTCENHKVDDVYNVLCAAITEAAVKWNIDTDWVHVIDEPVVGRHFSIKQKGEQL